MPEINPHLQELRATEMVIICVNYKRLHWHLKFFKICIIDERKTDKLSSRVVTVHR